MNILIRKYLVITCISLTLLGCSLVTNFPQSKIKTKDNLVNTATAQPSRTETKLPTATRTVEPTRTPYLSPTIDNNKMKKVVQNLFDERIIQTTGGSFAKLPMFNESWAQLFWYQWWYTDYAPTNFVLKADLRWESASTIANWTDSGCGFVYHTQDENNHHATFLMMDGNVISIRSVNGIDTPLQRGYAGKFKTPKDNATMILVLEKQWVTVFINGKKVVRFQDSSLNGGYLGYTLASGTNKDFGTRCIITNIELWELHEIGESTAF